MIAELAAEAARRCGLAEADIVAIWRAGMLHDVGRTGVSAGIWGKPERFRTVSGSACACTPTIPNGCWRDRVRWTQLGTLAASHHERLDGSGYHRGASASLLTPCRPAIPRRSRCLPCDGLSHALTVPPSLPGCRSRVASCEVRVGQFDSEAAALAVLAAAGHQVRTTRRALVAGLSEREVEVLRLLARGHSRRRIAGLLFISEKTISHHTQHIYTKIGVSTRAGATLFAMQHNLLATIG